MSKVKRFSGILDREVRMSNRREFIKAIGLGGAVTLVLPTVLFDQLPAVLSAPASAQSPSDGVWQRLPEILKRIKAPKFPAATS